GVYGQLHEGSLWQKVDGRCKASSAVPRSVVAVDTLASFMALLRLDRESGNRPGIETPQADRLSGLLAKSVSTVVDPFQRRLYLGDELALAVAGSKLKRAVGLG